MLPAHRTKSYVRLSARKITPSAYFIVEDCFYALGDTVFQLDVLVLPKGWFSVGTERDEILEHLSLAFLDICTRAAASTLMPCIETKCLSQLKTHEQRKGEDVMIRSNSTRWYARKLLGSILVSE